MRETFAADFDVIVAGAGVAGVAAALAAARAGSRTALVEKTVFPGGLATAGNVLAYLPLSDSRGQQVTFGIAEQLLRAALRYGPGDIPPDWRDPQTRSRFGSRFSPASLVLALDEELTGAGVEIWYDTLICQTVVAPVLTGLVHHHQIVGDRLLGVTLVLGQVAPAELGLHVDPAAIAILVEALAPSAEQGQAQQIEVPMPHAVLAGRHH